MLYWILYYVKVYNVFLLFYELFLPTRKKKKKLNHKSGNHVGIIFNHNSLQRKRNYLFLSQKYGDDDAGDISQALYLNGYPSFVVMKKDSILLLSRTYIKHLEYFRDLRLKEGTDLY